MILGLQESAVLGCGACRLTWRDAWTRSVYSTQVLPVARLGCRDSVNRKVALLGDSFRPPKSAVLGSALIYASASAIGSL